MPQNLSLKDLRNDPSIIEKFFSHAMTEEGYASPKSKPRAVPNLPGSKQIVFERDQWLFTDTWHTTRASDFTGGATHIYFDTTLVWMMHYFGNYPKHLIPYVFKALVAEYRKNSFNGGRGPQKLIFQREKLIYKNHAEASRFEYFSGLETLGPTDVPHDNKNSGWHRYHGGLML
jgi:hypothetical protein